ncbi:MAG TPA: hypothetical protein VFJ58_09750 [Armatimonadota bacterium]|nr:hypothetical protein [Armatimonadota bacterium]
MNPIRRITVVFSAILMLGCALATWAAGPCPTAITAKEDPGGDCYIVISYSGSYPDCTDQTWQDGSCPNDTGNSLACQSFEVYYTKKVFAPTDLHDCLGGCTETDFPNQHYFNARNGPNNCTVNG